MAVQRSDIGISSQGVFGKNFGQSMQCEKAAQ
jgi:hypothetical protein